MRTTVKSGFYDLCTSLNFDESYDHTLNLFTEVCPSPEAVKYLIKNRVMLKENVHCSNNQGQLFYNNASESVNQKIKSFMKHRSTQLYSFLGAMKEFMKCEQGSAEDGYFGISKSYKLIEGYNQPNMMLACISEKSKFLERMNTLSLSVSQQTSAAVMSSTAVSVQSTIDFSVTAASSGLDISHSILDSMFKKAEHLIVEKKIMPTPPFIDSDLGFSALSSSSCKHYYIALKLNGSVICDCSAFRSLAICSHAIAAAHLSDRLYGFICSLRKNNSAQPTSEVLTQTIDKSRAGMKSNQNKRKRRENVKTSRLVIDSCPVDHNKEGLIKYVLLCYHRQVQRCYGCGRKDMSDYETALAKKLYRQYIPKGQKRTPDNLCISYKKEWAYFHVKCSNFTEKCIHVCPSIIVTPTDKVMLENNGFRFTS